MNIPTGAVTFLFTDIEGSTKLSQDFPEKLNAALERHNLILKKALESNKGFIYDTIGDSFFCAFENAGDAVKAAVEIQTDLGKEIWDEAVIRVRIGIHSGMAEWNGDRYMGYITLARVARVMSAAYGEQILISNDAYKLFSNQKDTKTQRENESDSLCLSDLVVKNVCFRDLGERRLKDVIEPIRLYQVESEGLRKEFPPLKTLDARPNNLPIQLTSFIGREKEMKFVKEELKNSRLLTLTGTGGAGKSRLSLQAAADLIDDFANGVWFTELAAVSDPVFLPIAIINALGLKEENSKTPEVTLSDYLKDKEILIILDNCEQIIESCAKLTEKLLLRCPDLKIIATSREALNISGEQTYKIPPLSQPDPDCKDTPEQLIQYESVRLFIERALSVNHEFRVNKENAMVLAKVCSRLDGIPLAIELAAARSKVLSVDKINERLDDRFKLLTGGKRTALPRQQTLRALIDWSYDLLSDKEKNLWNRLSVFSGGWTLEAAEEICSDNIIDSGEIFEILSSLIEKSIVIYNDEKERFLILETIRQYAYDKIKETGEYEKFSDKHLKFYLGLAETKSKKLRGIESESNIKIFENEIGNLEKALKWSVENPANENGLRLSSAIFMFWQIRGYITEGIHWLETILETNTETNSPLYCSVICKLGNYKRLKGDVDKARDLIVESLKIRRELGDKSGTAESLIRLGILEYDQGRFDESAVLYEESLAIYRELGNKSSIAIVLNNLANVFSNQGNYSGSFSLYEESLAARRESGDMVGIAVCLTNLGILSFEMGEYEKAEALLQESLQLRHLTGNKEGIAISILNLGNVSYNQGDYVNALKLYKESLDISIEIDEKGCIADSLYNLGKTLLEQNDLEKALELFIESLDISQRIKAKTKIADTLLSMGRVAFERKEFEQSKRYYKESLELYRETGNRRYIVFNILRSAQMQIIEGYFIPGLQLLGFINREYLELKKIKFPLTDQIIYDKLLNVLKQKLTPEEFTLNFDQGKTLTLEEACQLVVNS
ncbi:MAG: tetratricopeptide repeat protein [Ignavibacteriae bacterium]|nr:tetratricopeptide repeat protein [Ignavibacteriota bacterium]